MDRDPWKDVVNLGICILVAFSIIVFIIYQMGGGK